MEPLTYANPNGGQWVAAGCHNCKTEFIVVPFLIGERFCSFCGSSDLVHNHDFICFEKTKTPSDFHRRRNSFDKATVSSHDKHVLRMLAVNIHSLTKHCKPAGTPWRANFLPVAKRKREGKLLI